MTMADYSKYPYRRMLYYVESRSRELGDDYDYIQYILSMEKANSIERMIKMYGTCYKILAYLFYGSKKLPRDWYVTETWGYDNGWLVEELNYCLNDNILKWYKNQEKISNEQVLKCISNLRSADNDITVQTEILSNSCPQVDKGILFFTYVRRRYYKLQKEIEKDSHGKKRCYMSYCRYLAAHGHILDDAELDFCSNNSLKFDNLVEEYYKEVAEAREKAKLQKKKEIEEERRLNRERSAAAFNSFGNFLFSSLLSFPFALFGGIIGNMNKKR